MRPSLAAIALGGLSIIALVPNHPSGRVPDEDAGVFLYVGQRILDGGLPYRDVWDHKPPLVYYLDAAGLLITPGRLDGVWALQVVGLWAATVLLFLALAPTLGRGAAIFASAALALFVPRFVLAGGLFTNFTELFGLPFQAAALYAYARGQPGRPRWAVPFGVLGGLTVALKPPLLGPWIAVAICVAAPLARGGHGFGRWLAALVAGALVVPIAALAYFAANGAADDLWDQAIVYNGAYVSGASLADRIAPIVVGGRYALYSGVLAVGAVGAVIALLRYALRSADERRPRVPPVVVVAIVSLPIAIPLAAASGNDYGIYALPWGPTLAVLAGYAAAWTMETARRSAAFVPSSLRAATGPVLLAALFAAMAVRPAGLLWRGATTGDDGKVRAVVDYVRAQTTADDLVLVWGARTEVLVLADRRAPTRFVYQYAPLYTTSYLRPERTAELLHDIERRRPLIIIDASSISPLSVPLDAADLSAWSSYDPNYALPPGIEGVLAYVRGAYTRSGAVGEGWNVYRLAEPPPP